MKPVTKIRSDIKRVMGKSGSMPVAVMAVKLGLSVEEVEAAVESEYDPNFEIVVDLIRVNGELVSQDQISYFTRGA